MHVNSSSYQRMAKRTAALIAEHYLDNEEEASKWRVPAGRRRAAAPSSHGSSRSSLSSSSSSIKEKDTTKPASTCANVAGDAFFPIFQISSQSLKKNGHTSKRGNRARSSFDLLQSLLAEDEPLRKRPKNRQESQTAHGHLFQFRLLQEKNMCLKHVHGDLDGVTSEDESSATPLLNTAAAAIDDKLSSLLKACKKKLGLDFSFSSAAPTKEDIFLFEGALSKTTMSQKHIQEEACKTNLLLSSLSKSPMVKAPKIADTAKNSSAKTLEKNTKTDRDVERTCDDPGPGDKRKPLIQLKIDDFTQKKESQDKTGSSAEETQARSPPLSPTTLSARLRPRDSLGFSLGDSPSIIKSIDLNIRFEDHPHREARGGDADRPNLKKIVLGDVEMDVWYNSPYPSEYVQTSGSILWICPWCLKYMSHPTTYDRHLHNCREVRPPGREVHRQPSPSTSSILSIFELDGSHHKLYCQNLCLLAKCFLEHKILYYDVNAFLFYVLTEYSDASMRVVGYFSKERHTDVNNNVSCIVVFPAYQGRGYGQYLIDYSRDKSATYRTTCACLNRAMHALLCFLWRPCSFFSVGYALTRREGKAGGPETPLSDLGFAAYAKYWMEVIIHEFHKMNSSPLTWTGNLQVGI